MNILFRALLISAIGFLSASCEKILPSSPEENEVLDGTIDALSTAETAKFLRGDGAFTRVFTSSTGLGPLFVSNSCISCHAGDGKGHPSTSLVRFGQINEMGNQFMNQGGPQLQHRAIVGFMPETIPSGATHSTFIAPANTGLGFLEAVSDADILALSDPEDKNNDGISGVPNWIELADFVKPKSNSISKNGKYIGRFGRKAGAYNLLNQTVNAYNQDMGIVSSFSAKDTFSGENQEPEVSDNEIMDLVLYLQTLKAPLQRNVANQDIKDGKVLFVKSQCSSCHIPQMTTGSSSIAGLNNKTFAAYTDLLMHDMGKALDDNYTEGTAKTYEWRTTPLWGLGLSKDSQGGKVHLLHDGRAKSIDEAITLHGGEAVNSREKYSALSTNEKQLLIKFLESL
ncbi:thiol oxidoreductase [Lacihabitans sp. CCS-44]|uniref:di-heme oxidoredictase family protein n=1 Tax=Lacihabitans sp. CCS-44 TaxID=2487331 RepID=UPI0020CDDAF2|nr:di-heme oxidoredictase family protein [Lacihabitans sp. CCS-44]MCP9755948.1 thiol oxidoreductase [Lacihabitans sp. CCS-44]